MRNNNPGNVKNDPANPWQGSVGTDAQGHAVFESEADGVRAMIRNLAQYARAGRRCLLAICRAWAPASDTVGSLAGRPANNPIEYAEFLADRLNFPLTADLPIFDVGGNVVDMDMLKDLIDAMTEYEQGAGVRPRRLSFLKGLLAYTEDFIESVPAPTV